ncbi:MFS transporter [Pseudonocardia acaciae]|uniref:MFS transporter n=1 Tax=Pseudonocardia acaciae TaxID=551276 RepID=UPI00048F6986|nr:MFS transporter [Pseudonocardia acaciae]
MTRAATRTGTTARPLFLATILLGTVLQPLNSSMIAVALVSIRTEFDAGAAASWLVSGLYITTAVAAPAMGRLADLVGARRVYLAGMTLVGLASAATPFVPGLGWLIAIRVLLGVGTAAQYPAAVALLRADTDRRGGSATGTLGLLAVSGQVTVALGPSLGGVLVGAFGWQAVFLANLPMVALGSALALRALPPGRAHPGGHLLRRLDIPGMAAFTVAMTALMALLLSLTTGVRWWLLPVFLAALAALVWRELRAAEPFLDLRALAGNTALTGTYLRVGLTYTAFYLIFYGLPQWLEQGRRLDVTLTGLVMLPLAAFGAATVLAATRLERRRGPRPLLIVGSAALLLGGLLLAGPLHSGTALWLLVAVSALLGLPNGFNNVGNQTEMFRAADRRSVGAASGLYRTSQYIGANLAAAVLELTFAGPPSDPGLHRMGLVVAAASAVLLTAAILNRRR